MNFTEPARQQRTPCNRAEDVNLHARQAWAAPLAGIVFCVFLLAAGPRLQGGENPLTQIKTVFLIVMENHSWAGIAGKAAECPFINNTLIPRASIATQYFTPPQLHPSEPNYIWLESGTNFGILNDSASNRINSTNHLVTQLEHAGVTWKGYFDGIAADGYPSKDVYPYVVRHNAQFLFNDVNSRKDYVAAHMRPMEELASDLQNTNTSRYNIIIPGLTNDMHDLGPGYTSRRTEGDHWLSLMAQKILDSAAFRDNGALFITWDEGDGGSSGFSDGPIGMLVLSPLAKGGGYQNAIRYTHSSTLRTMQEIFEVSPFLGDAANSADLSDLFLFPTFSALPGSGSGVFQTALSGLVPGREVVLQQAGPDFFWTNLRTTKVSAASLTLALPCTNSACFFRALIPN